MSGVLQYAVMHPYSVEIYRILEGSGTLVTGGLLILPLADSPSEDVVRTEHGIPHLYASSDTDLACAMGFVSAQERNTGSLS